MRLVNLLDLLRVVVDLKNEPVLRPDQHVLRLLLLLQRGRVLISVVVIQHRVNAIPGVVPQNHNLPRQVLILNPPEPDVLLPARDQFVQLDRGELQTQDVEVGHLLREDLRLLPLADLADVPDDYHLPVVIVGLHRGEQIVVARQRNALHVPEGDREGVGALVLVEVPDADVGLFALGARHQEVAVPGDVDAGHGLVVPDEEALVPGLGFHADDGVSADVNQLLGLVEGVRPPDVGASVSGVSDGVFQVGDRVRQELLDELAFLLEDCPGFPCEVLVLDSVDFF